MSNTRFMDRLFSATENGEVMLTDQVAADIESARNFGEVDTDEVIYKSDDNGNVTITDKENGEVTVAESTSEEGVYDLYNPEDAVEEPLEGYLHPEMDGVTPGVQQGEPMEDVSEDHLGGAEINELDPSCEEEEGCEEEREFSVSSDNTVVNRIFSDQEFCERLFSEIIESEQTSVVGDLKVELDPEEENTVVVTSEATGDQAKVKLDNETMEVTELESKNFSGYCETDYAPLYVVGVDAVNNVLIDAPAYGEEAAQDLATRLAEKGVEAIQILGTPDEARDYAFQLFGNLGVDPTEEGVIEEPIQAEFSEHDIYLTQYHTDNTVYMDRLFSEAINDIDASQSAIEDAIGSGDEIETDTEIITPVDATTAVIEDKENGEFTKVVLDGDDMDLSSISEEEAEGLTDHLVTNGEEVDEEEEKDFSDIYCNEEETRFFSENEAMTSYMERLYSEDADQDEIESAIETGEQIENETEIITPVDANTAIIEDKVNGEFTKAEIDGGIIDVNPISEEEADKLTDGLVPEEDVKEEETSEKEGVKEEETLEEKEDEEIEEKGFSESPQLTKFFNEVIASQGTEVEEEKPTVEVIEDKALTAIQSIQEAAQEATQAIMEAKEAPVEQPEGDLKEAQFSNTTINNQEGSTLISWIQGAAPRK